MEGFEHYFITDRNIRLARIISFLDAADSPNVRPVREMCDWIERELGTWEPDAVCDFVFLDENSVRVDRWGRDFDQGLQPMWVAVTSYLKDHRGIELADEVARLDDVSGRPRPGPAGEGLRATEYGKIEPR
jgi:hypothetical protein